MTRRKTLALIGGGAVLAASAGAGIAVTRTPNIATAPWAQAGRYDEIRRYALSYAILAPNPHNRQPWKVDLGTPGQAVLYVDTDRLLPHTDPFSRQIVIGLGCFLEVMRMAAAERGYGVDVALFPEGSDPERLDARPVAVCKFTEGQGTADPLFAHVPNRRSLKEPYDVTRPVDEDILARIVSAAQTTASSGTVKPADIAEFRELSHEALRIEIETPHTYKESVDLFRIGSAEVNANPDGIDFSGPMFETLALTGMFTREIAMDQSSMAYQSGLDAVFANADTGMGYIWSVTATNTREDQIAAGRDWVRLNLACTAEGVATQPLSQALQEYPEMAALYDQIHERLAPAGGTVQMFARIGYGKDVPVSPRWPIDAKMMNG
ncbi:MAG: twin-arginine translocation pathway signal protein [Rhodobacteraceae bacterium]|nr:twin-arginine translocation pathway signal protein [Paracoccaceae bacterium]